MVIINLNSTIVLPPSPEKGIAFYFPEHRKRKNKFIWFVCFSLNYSFSWTFFIEQLLDAQK